MNRYLTFSHNSWEPEGGWNDFVGDFELLDDAIEFLIEEHHGEDKQIVDTETLEIVWEE